MKSVRSSVRVVAMGAPAFCLALLLAACGEDQATAEFRRLVGHWVVDTAESWERTVASSTLEIPLGDNIRASFEENVKWTLEVTQSGAVALRDERSGRQWVGTIEDTGSRFVARFTAPGRPDYGAPEPVRLAVTLQPIEGGILANVAAVTSVDSETMAALKVLSRLVKPQLVFRPKPEGNR